MVNSFKQAVKGVSSFVKAEKKSMRPLLVSVISLLLVTVTFISMSFSWFTIKTSTLYANNFTLDCGKGLRVNDTGVSEFSFSQQKNKYLIPASSVDGRNLYFPTDGSDFSSTTENMTFRSANVGDKNVNYIQIDFTLTAQQNHTALYINDEVVDGEEKTSIKVKSQNETEWSVPQAAALRSALWSSTAEDGVPNTPIVFNPTKSTMRTAAVEDVDRSTGAFISSGRQVAHSFSEYAYGGTPVATLSKGVETKFSYIIWLEGTDPKCTDRILQKDIQINLSFTTSWDKTQSIRFKDGTDNQWVKNLLDNNHYSLTLHYDEINPDEVTEQNPQTSSMDFNMWKNYEGDTWSCNIPGDMTKYITFILRPSSQSEGETHLYKFVYNSQSTASPRPKTYDRGSNRLYVAEIGPLNGSNYTTCQGYWMAIGDSNGAGHDSGNMDGDDF